MVVPCFPEAKRILVGGYLLVNTIPLHRTEAATVGSVNPVAKTQMDELFLAQKVWNVFVDTKELLESDERRATEIERVVKAILDHCEPYEVCTVIGNGIMPENRIDFAPYTAKYQC